LRQKLGEDASDDFIELLNKTSEETKGRVLELSADKFEHRLSEEIGKVRVEMHSIKSDLIKWMFIFWVGQLGAMIALFFAFLRK
jgi:hypothetical protein